MPVDGYIYIISPPENNNPKIDGIYAALRHHFGGEKIVVTEYNQSEELPIKSCVVVVIFDNRDRDSLEDLWNQISRKVTRAKILDIPIISLYIDYLERNYWRDDYVINYKGIISIMAIRSSSYDEDVNQLIKRIKLIKKRKSVYTSSLLVAGTSIVVACMTLIISILFRGSGENDVHDFLPADFNIEKWRMQDSLKSLDSLKHVMYNIDSTIQSKSVQKNNTQSVDSLYKKFSVAQKQVEDLLAGAAAILGYSYPSVLKRREIGHINAFINTESNERGIREKINIIIDKQTLDRDRKVMCSVFTENLIVYDSILVELVDPQTLFSQSAIHNSNNQKINRFEGNRWEWTIWTTTDKSEAELILKVTAKSPNNDLRVLDPKYISIKIEIDSDSFLRRAWIYIVDNPGKILGAIGTIFVGLVGYFWKKRFDDDKKSKENNSSRDSENQDQNKHETTPLNYSASIPIAPKFQVGEIVQHKFNKEILTVEEYLDDQRIRCSLLSNRASGVYLQEDLEPM